MFTNQIFIWIEVKTESRFHQLYIHVTNPPIVLLPGRHKLNTSVKCCVSTNQRRSCRRNKNKYRLRELVENAFFRFKNAFGSKFLSRDEDSMENEMTIKCQLLNKMFEIGKPISVRLDKTRLWEKR